MDSVPLFVNDLKQGKCTILDCVEKLNPKLISCDHLVRAEGVKILASIVKLLDVSALNDKEIKVLTEFMQKRLADHQSMELEALNCLHSLAKCTKKPADYLDNLLNYFKTKLNVRKLEPRGRFVVYDIVSLLFEAKVTANERSISSELMYGVIHLIEGESNPENLLLIFKLLVKIMKNFTNLEPFVDDIFEWLSSYYPIQYTPSEEDKQQSSITRDDLVEALHNCFFATTLNADNLLTLLVEKLDSSIIQTKMESLKCIQRCLIDFDLAKIEDYITTIFTSTRMDCLKDLSLVDQKLIALHYETLSCLSKKLSSKERALLSFVDELYDQLFMAFKNLDLKLFEPAIRLISHASIGSLKCYNLVINRLIPIIIQGNFQGNLGVVKGIQYMIELLAREHEKSTNNRCYFDINDGLDTKSAGLFADLIGKLSEVPLNQTGLDLIELLAWNNVPIEKQVSDSLVKQLNERYNSSDLDIEKGLVVLKCYPDWSLESTINRMQSLVPNYHVENIEEPLRFFGNRRDSSLYLREVLFLVDIGNAKLTLDKQPVETLKGLLTWSWQLLELNDDESFSFLMKNISMVNTSLLNKLPSETIEPILLSYFQSKYCQSLVDKNVHIDSKLKYLELMKWIWKALAVRNHKFATPLTNLLLNVITSDQSQKLAYQAALAFGFVQDSSSETVFPFVKSKGYNTFFLHKQKLYSQSMNEIILRSERMSSSSSTSNDNLDGTGEERGNSSVDLLLLASVCQIRHLPMQVYKKNIDWITKRILKFISCAKSKYELIQIDDSRQQQQQQTNYPENIDTFEDILFVVLCSTNSLISAESKDMIKDHLFSYVNCFLIFASKAKKLLVRRASLEGLSRIANSFDESELLPNRDSVCLRLKYCLNDKKRLVREAASKARNNWILVGQPFG